LEDRPEKDEDDESKGGSDRFEHDDAPYESINL
jgi:hypothetical protein